MVKKINYVLSKGQKIQLTALLLIIFVGAFIELLGVSSILPVINIALDASAIDDTWYLLKLKNMLGFTDASQMLIFLAGALIGVYIVKNIYISLMYNAQYRFIFENQRKLAVRLMECYMHQKYLFHVSRNVAELQRNVTEDVNGFFTVLLGALQLLVESSVCIVLVVFLIMKDVTTTVMLAVLVLIFFAFFTGFFKKVLGKKGAENRETCIRVAKWILQAFSGIKEIKVINGEQFFIDNYDKNFRRFATLQRQQSMLTFIPRPMMETICIAGLLLAVIIKVQFGGGDVSSFIPILSIFAVAAFRMLPSFNRITGYLGSIMFNKPAVDAVYKDLVEIEELMRTRDEEEKDTTVIELNNVITLENLSFHYPETSKQILQHANLIIEKNTSVAFIGASGAGKTTAADLILGLLEPQGGRITVDGADIKEHLQAWHKCIGYIPQTIYLMDDTIRANIAFGIAAEQIDDTAIERAMREAQLYEFVQSLEQGLDTVIGDRGVKLSGGQRQRIGIARALYRDPQVLILDEATSALDNETEAEVMRAIDGLHGTRTLIVIAHRLTTIKNCDFVYEVVGGRFMKVEKVPDYSDDRAEE